MKVEKRISVSIEMSKEEALKVASAIRAMREQAEVLGDKVFPVHDAFKVGIILEQAKELTTLHDAIIDVVN